MCESPVIPLAMNFVGVLPECSRNTSSHDSEKQLVFGRHCETDRSFKIEVSSTSGEDKRPTSCHGNLTVHSCRSQLEEDVQRMQQILQEEMELHVVLENAMDHTGGMLHDLACLPDNAHELLSNIATLEVTVSRLEQEMVSLHYHLIQERNERRLAEYRLRQLPSQPLLLCSSDAETLWHSSSIGLNQFLSEFNQIPREVMCTERKDLPKELPSQVSGLCLISEDTIEGGTLSKGKKSPPEIFQHAEVVKLKMDIPIDGLWNYPNQLSEEMVRCMKYIFVSLADPSTDFSRLYSLENLGSSVSPHEHRSSSFLWSLSEASTIFPWVQCPEFDLQCKNEVLANESSFDAYKVRGKLSWKDIGNYSVAIEVSWMSVGKKQLDYASAALKKFRLLIEQLAMVNPIPLSGDEKLAFWINLYNALLMHAYLAYGVPRSELKLHSLMQKAAYTVGGHSFSAAAIEYVILKMKPPVHRPQLALLLALHKLKVSEEKKKFSIETCEPLVAFALSCGMYSSPAVRIYSPGNVREGLREAQRDFIRASVGVSTKGKLLVPKMLHCFAKGFISDANLAVWISRFLPPLQAAFVEQCMLQRRSSTFLGRNCAILPFDSRFRYLFLPEILPGQSPRSTLS